MISVVLGEPSEAARDADTVALLRWGLDRFHRVRALDPARPLARAEVEYRDERAPLVPGARPRCSCATARCCGAGYVLPSELEGPLPAGDRVGAVTVLVDGRPVRRVALVTARDVPGAGTMRVLVSALGVPLTLLAALAILGAAAFAVTRYRVRLRLVK